MRRAIEPLRIRYYAVGEYGDATFRPHYHVMLFGYPRCMRGVTKVHYLTGEPMWSECCEHCRLIGNTWGHGNVFLGDVSKDSAGYIAGYTVKKMTSKDDKRLLGRHPEFARMSLRPGIGSDAMFEVASTLKRYALDGRPDVPASLAHGSSSRPLGRYLRGRLREMIGRDKGAPQATLEALEAELLPLRLAARSDDANPSFRSHILNAAEGEFRKFSARNEIYKGRKSL